MRNPADGKIQQSVDAYATNTTLRLIPPPRTDIYRVVWPSHLPNHLLQISSALRWATPALPSFFATRTFTSMITAFLGCLCETSLRLVHEILGTRNITCQFLLGCKHVSKLKLQLALLTQGNLQSNAHLRKENHEPQDSIVLYSPGCEKQVHKNV